MIGSPAAGELRNRYRDPVGSLRPLLGTGYLAGVLCRAHHLLLCRSGSSVQGRFPRARLSVNGGRPGAFLAAPAATNPFIQRGMKLFGPNRVRTPDRARGLDLVCSTIGAIVQVTRIDPGMVFTR